MKNITVSLDDETYRKARIVAAQSDASVSALVRKHLISFAPADGPTRDFRQEQNDLLDRFWEKYPHFSSKENLSREELYRR